MRVLVLFALVACVSTAPSHLVPIGLIALPIPVPTVPSGDLQAAAIDAQVKMIDQVQEMQDQARQRAELAVENPNEGVLEANDLAKEKSEQAFWAAEEKKWAALNEAQVAAAKLDGSVSSNIAAYKQAQVLPYAAVGSPILAPVVPVPGAAAAAVSSESDKGDANSAGAGALKSADVSEAKLESTSEVKSEDKESVEVSAAGVKSADLMKAEEVKPAEEMKEGAIPEIQKFGLTLQALKAGYPAQLAVAPSIFPAPIAYPAYKSFPVAAVPYPGHYYAPAGSLACASDALHLVHTVPIVRSEDQQTAAIDAQVKIDDQAQNISDQDRERAELAVENQNEEIIEANDLEKEKSEEDLWAAEEKKWHALNEAQVAAAKLDGSVSSADTTEVKSGVESEVVEMKEDVTEIQKFESPFGDLQAEAIDTLVKIGDQAQKLADHLRGMAEKIANNQNNELLEANDLAKEKSEEAFWAAEEKKWQELNEAQVAAAKLDGDATARVSSENDKTDVKSVASAVNAGSNLCSCKLVH